MLATILAVVALVSAFTTATVIFLDERGTAGLTSELSLRSGSDLALRASFDRAIDAEQQDAEVRAAIERTFAPTGVDFTVIRALESEADYKFVTVNGVKVSGPATASTFPDLEDHARFDTGAAPRGDRDVAVQTDAAALLGVKVGDELFINELPFTISGTWQALDPLDPRWYGDERVANGGGDRLGPFAIDESAWTRTSSTPIATWTIVPTSIEQITATNFPALRLAWGAAREEWRGTVTGYESMAVEQRFSRTLYEFGLRIAGLRAIEPVVFVLMAGIALVGLSQIVQLLVTTRERESTLFLARGQPPGALAARLTAEVGVSALIGAALGSAAVAAVVIAMGRGAELTGLRSVAFVVPALVVGGAVALAAISAAHSAQSISTPSRGGRRSGRVRRVAVPGVVVLVTIGAALAVRQLRLYGSPLITDAAGSTSIDPVAVAAPAAALSAVVLIGLAGFPAIVGVWARRAGTTGVRAHLAVRTLARHTRRVVAPLVVVALAVGSATIAASFSATWSSSFARAAQLSAGADVRVSSRSAPISPIHMDAVAGAEGVSAVAPIDLQTLAVGTIRGITLAASPDAVRELVTTAEGTFLPEEAASAIQMDATGPSVPTGALGLTLRVEALGFDAPPTLKAWIADPLGRLHTVPFGKPTAEPDGVLAFSADPRGLEGTIVSFDVGLPSQSVENSPSFRLVELVAAIESSEQTLDLDQFWLIDTLTAQQRAPDSFSGGDGFALDSPLLFLRMTASLDGTRNDELNPRLLVSEGLASAVDLAIGDTVVFGIREAEGRLSGVVAGIVPSIPGARNDHAVLMDLAVNNHLRLRSEPVPSAMTDLWVGTDAPERVRDEIRTSLPADTLIETSTDPVGRQVLGAASIAMWAAALCCLLIAIVGVASASRSRLRWGREEFGSLRAIGLSARDQSSVIRREMGVVLAVATTTGLIAGAVVSLLTVPQLAQAAVDRAYLSGETAFSIDWSGLVMLLGALAGGIAVVLANLGRGVRVLASTSLPGTGHE